MSRANEAATLIASSQMNCAQSVLSVFCEELGLDKTLALKVSLPFGAGMGRTGGICGAVTGAYMVLGLRAYPDLSSPSERKERVYFLVTEFNRHFATLNKSLNCNELLNCDLGTQEGLSSARSRKLFSILCPKLVTDAVNILEEMFTA
jgi:C_GCAxxG_C_C family probable redox protein